MTTQNLTVALMIICLAAIVASILKFAEKNQLRIFTVIASLLMPILLSTFMVSFFIYVYKKDFSSLAFPKKIIKMFSFMLLEIQVTPLIHTTLVNTICETQEEPKFKLIFPLIKKNIFNRMAVESLHEKYFC